MEDHRLIINITCQRHKAEKASTQETQNLLHGANPIARGAEVVNMLWVQVKSSSGEPAYLWSQMFYCASAIHEQVHSNSDHSTDIQRAWSDSATLKMPLMLNEWPNSCWQICLRSGVDDVTDNLMPKQPWRLKWMPAEMMQNTAESKPGTGCPIWCCTWGMLCIWACALWYTFDMWSSFTSSLPKSSSGSRLPSSCRSWP